jgi:hypothetical protein
VAGWWRRFRWPPFFGEVGIDPLAKPGFFVSPTEPLGDEDLADATALHANAFDAAQVVYQPIQRPGGVALFSQVGRPGERGLNDLTDELWLVGHGPTRAWRFFESLQSLLIEAMEPIAHHTLAHIELLGNLRRPLSLARQPDDLRSFAFPHRRVSCMHQSFNRLLFFLAQFSQSERHLLSPCLPAFLLPQVYHTCRMHHLA